MKKPKTKKPQVKVPKDALVVDYGRKRVILPYKWPIDLYNKKELYTICTWCKETFPVDTWRVSQHYWPGHIFFLKESYVTIFLLKWAK